MPDIQYASVQNVCASKHFEDTDTRKHFDAYLTSPTADSYGRIVSPESMPNIAQQASAGVRVLDSHKHDTNGIGQTVRGEVVKEIVEGIEKPKVLGSAYILLGLKLDGQTYKSTNDWAKVIDDGMANSFSIGFYSEREICNLCGEKIFSYRCRHYPKEWYTVTNTDTGEEERVQCTYTCFECRLVELSFVYAGANPDARLVQKAKAFAEQNLLNPEQIKEIENRLQTAILETNNRSYFDMPLNDQDKKDIAATIADALKPITQQIAALEAQNTAAPQPPPHPEPPPIPPYAIAAPQPQPTITAEDLAKAVKEAIEPFGERLEKVATAVQSGDSINDREAALAALEKQYTRVHGKAPDDALKASWEAYPDVATITHITEAFQAAANEIFHAGRKSEGLGDELKSTQETNDNPFAN